MPGFVEVQITTSSSELVTQAIERWTALMQLIYPGWEPPPNDILTIAIEALGPLASDVSQVAAALPAAAFRRFGTELLKLPFNEGARATGTALVTVTQAPNTIPQGTQVILGTLGFYVQEAVEVKAGHTTAKVTLVAQQVGTEYNGLTGVGELSEAIDWISEVTLEGETSGGVAEESDEEYEQRLAAELALQAPRPVNAVDFAPFVLSAPESLGFKVGRAVSKDLYNAITAEEGVPFCTSTWATGPLGEELTKADYEKLEEWLKPFLPQNFIAPVKPPSYETLYATVKLHAETGYNKESVAASVKAVIESLLSPKNWGRQQAATTGSQQWELQPLVRYNVILASAGSVPGVAYLLDGSEGLAIGTAPSPTGVADITLTGAQPVVLPRTTPSTVLVTAV